MEGCEHLEAIGEVKVGPHSCEECVKIGSTWVHLRTCQTCGLYALLRLVAESPLPQARDDGRAHRVRVR